ncbi:hypothetical protein ACQKQD_18360 [Methylobacterium sp. NPDC080182]|uniref:hypothetical protein n=1 Tax=Methylobacterium sp. NPDC080182 TaxID=3390590 RepID=UPI003D01BDEA
MAETSAFALRMPPEIKAAAKALTKVGFDEPSDAGEGLINNIWCHSINDALCYLLRTGLKGTLTHIDTAIADFTKKVAISGEMMAWFLQNPAASNILPHNLPEASPARAELQEIMFPDGVEDEQWTGGMSRREVTQSYAGEQQRLYDLVEAKGVIQKALAARG